MATLRRSFRAFGAALVFGSVALACAAITGLGDYEITDLDAAIEAGPNVLVEAGTPPVVRPDATPDEPKDATPDAPRECVPSTCEPPGSGAPDGGPLDGGFSVVLVGDGEQLCPALYTTTDAIASPTTNPATPACACGDCSASVSCTSGTVQSMHTGPSCATIGVTFPNTIPGGCNNLSTNAAATDAGSAQPPPAVIGACTSPGSGIRSAVFTTPKRICTPSECAGDACMAPPGFSTCFLSAGDVACPTSSAGDLLRTLVGEDVTVACPACSCMMAAQCTGSLDRYSGVDCTGTKATITTAACLPQPAGLAIKSYRWTGTPVTTCTKGTPPLPDLTMTKVRTLCCMKQ